MSTHDCETVDISDGPCPKCYKGNEPQTLTKAKPIGEKCSDCEGYLVERVNSLTKNTFIGCSEWPDCNFTERGGANPSPVKTYAPSYSDYDDAWDDGDGYSDPFGWEGEF